ncbi:hypothetical protein S245_052866 [Arachis hypogaea]
MNSLQWKKLKVLEAGSHGTVYLAIVVDTQIQYQSFIAVKSSIPRLAFLDDLIHKKLFPKTEVSCDRANSLLYIPFSETTHSSNSSPLTTTHTPSHEQNSQNFSTSATNNTSANFIPISGIEIQLPPPESSSSASNFITTNQHPMVTRSKVRIHKPKALLSVSPELDLVQNVPSTTKQALTCHHWIQAMKKEYEAALRNNTWTITQPPPNSTVIGC